MSSCKILGRSQVTLMMKGLLSSIPPMDRDAVETVEKKIAGQSFKKWDENVVVDKHFGIDNKMFPSFVRELKVLLDIGDEQVNKLIGVHKYAKTNELQKFEKKYNHGDLNARYIFFVVCKQQEWTDMIYAYYKLDAELDNFQGERLKKKQRIARFSWFGGRIKFGSREIEIDEYEYRNQIPFLTQVQGDKKVDAYFRSKALEGFENEGLIDNTKTKTKRNK